MTTQYMEAFSEVDAILNIMPKDLFGKIPLSFRNIISNQKSKTYAPNISPKIPIEKQELKKETRAILSTIYRSYLVDGEEKEKLKLEDFQELKKIEKELREKYNTDNLFKNKKMKIETIEEINELPATYFETKWYNKIINTFKNLILRLTKGKK